MIKLYYGRANINREKYIFEKIRDEIATLPGGDFSRILYIVPDQYTITAERVAFQHIGSDGFMDLEILSFSRLMARIIEETTRSQKIHIDKYGRHMLIEKIISENKESFEAFKGIPSKPPFIEIVNNFISEMKQFNTKPEDLIKIIKDSSEKEILNRKIRDIHKIFSEYEKAIDGKYLDTEDFINLVSENVLNSKLINSSTIYFQGFDYFSPKALQVIHQLSLHAGEVNIVLQNDQNDQFFQLANVMVGKIKDFAKASNIKVEEFTIPSQFGYKVGNNQGQRKPEIAYLEKQLYAVPHTKYETKDEILGIQLYSCSNYYTEVENAAAKILELTRDEGYCYEDIVVICNDVENRESIIKRIFSEYEIPFFIDSKKSVLQNPYIKFITSVLEIIEKGYRYEDIFTCIKTGLTPIEPEMGELLENYAYEYKLSKKNWFNGFRNFKKNTDNDTLTIINNEREKFISFVTKLEKPLNEARTARKKILALYEFLVDVVGFPVMAIDMADKFKKNGQEEYGEEFMQIWDVIVHIMDQMAELMGDGIISNTTFKEIITAGFNSVEVGIIPQAMDQVIVGTIQRTRTKDIKALMVLGANDGLIPMEDSGNELLNEDEKQFLYDKKYELCKNENFRKMEESLAIYSMLSKPMQYLYISYSTSDRDGKELRQSIIFDKIKKIFPQICIGRDLVNGNSEINKINSKRSTLRHLTYEMKKETSNGNMSSLWKQTFNWFKANSTDASHPMSIKINTIQKGLAFQNREEKIGNEMVHLLYGKGEELDIVLSSSRIESFAKCPFAYLIRYGLAAGERKQDEVAGREIGDIYHECMMRLARDLTQENIEIKSGESLWSKVSKEECFTKVEEIISSMEKNYMSQELDSFENIKYRFHRIQDVCCNSAWAMVEQARAGKIENAYFEAEFGREPQKQFKELQIDIGLEKVFIEGKIDRVDVIEASGESFVKIIDYKSGNDKFSMEEAVGGTRVQLLLYLKAASEGLNLQPCAAFYFKLDKPLIDVSKLASEQEESGSGGRDIENSDKFKSGYKMDGIILGEKEIIEAVDGDFLKQSKIIPVYKKVDGEFGASSKSILTREEFSDLQLAVDMKVQNICSALISGEISISPKKIKDKITACNFCPYKSICNFDQCFKGNQL